MRRADFVLEDFNVGRIVQPMIRVFSVLVFIGVYAFPAATMASVHHDFVHKYSELNLGNWSHDRYEFADAQDFVNSFNRSLGIAIPIGPAYPVNTDFSTQMVLRYGSNVWKWSDGSVVSARPRSPFFNAGLGWNLGFGRMIAPSANPYGLWVYESSDGKSTRFYDNFDGETPVANVFYSHDSPSLRLKVLSNGTRLVLEFPDGNAQEFRRQAGSWEIFKRYDQFGNYQLFSYRLDLDRVTTSDNHGRTQWIHFKADPSGYFDRVIDKVRVTRPVSSVAVYTFNYSSESIGVPFEDTDPGTPRQVTVPVLTGIVGPGGDPVASFAYESAGNAAGRLNEFVDGRFGGQLKYTYASVDMPYVQNPAKLNESMDHFAADVIGVAARDKVDFDGSLLGTWSFYTVVIGGTRSTPPSLDQPTGLRTEARTPDEFRDFRYFRVAINDTSGPSPQEAQVKTAYGLPGRGGGVLLQADRAIMRNGTSWSEGWQEVSYSQYGYECPSCLDPSPSVLKDRVLVKDAPASTREYANRNWAGQAAVIDEYDSANSAPRRITTLDLDPGVPATSEPWINRPWSRKTISAGANTSVMDQCVNDFGQITRSRELRNSTRASNDFVSEYVYDNAGNRIETRHFGGDGQSVATGELCTINLPAPQFRQYTNYLYGSKSGSGYLSVTGGIIGKQFSAQIDRPTGLMLTFSDISDFTQTLGYDAQARPLSITPPAGHGERIATSYAVAAGATPATTTTTGISESGSTLSKRIEIFDGFGNPIEEQELGPGGWATTTTSYDAMGRKVAVIAPDGGVTRFLNRDYKGRPGIIRPPEGSQHDTGYTYVGNTVTVRKWIAKDLSSNPPVESFRDTRTTYDRYHRRIIQVNADQDGTNRTRTTTYDMNGHWVTKSENGTTLDNLNQYDATGLLVTDSYGSSHSYNSLMLPLKEYSRYGDRVDLGYDEAGRMISKSHAGQVYVDLDYGASNSPGEYNKNHLVRATRYNRNLPDVAGGLIIVEDNFVYSGKGGRPGMRYTLIKDSAGSDLLQYSSQVNYTDDGFPESFYSASCSGSATISCNQRSKTYEYTYSYGLLTGVTQTDSDGASEYWLYGITYNEQQRPLSYTFGNGLVTQLGYDQSSSQPESIWVQDGASILWGFGSAYVDGAGNTTHQGVELVLWDDFYQLQALKVQATEYVPKSTNSENRQDPLGMVTVKTGEYSCYGAYPPCVDINVYNYENRLVWLRNRPFDWPSSPVGMKTPSYLYFFDALQRNDGWNEGQAWYYNNKYTHTISLTGGDHSDFSRHDVVHGTGQILGADNYAGIQRARTYFHGDLNTTRFGTSNSTKEFLPRK